MFGKLIENKIREAMEAGEFDNLPGKGKSLDLEAYFATPPGLRLGYSVLKSARCLPEEIELRKEIESLTEQIDRCTDEPQRQNLYDQLNSKTLKLVLGVLVAACFIRFAVVNNRYALANQMNWKAVPSAAPAASPSTCAALPARHRTASG